MLCIVNTPTFPDATVTHVAGLPDPSFSCVSVCVSFLHFLVALVRVPGPSLMEHGTQVSIGSALAEELALLPPEKQTGTE